MSRYKADKPDTGTKEIVEALRSLDMQVFYMARPLDLLVGWRGRWVVLECKPKGRKRRADQEKQSELIDSLLEAGLPLSVVTDPTEALKAMRYWCAG